MCIKGFKKWGPGGDPKWDKKYMHNAATGWLKCAQLWFVPDQTTKYVQASAAPPAYMPSVVPLYPSLDELKNDFSDDDTDEILMTIGRGKRHVGQMVVNPSAMVRSTAESVDVGKKDEKVTKKSVDVGAENKNVDKSKSVLPVTLEQNNLRMLTRAPCYI
ncbi:Hypothetical predicted protein [Pelobates cultripes]|uniref:Uncharacterized protein n=1 Tax=Pelobates cultripes TaxID=61616 RepID=A0AAD1TPB1_PELCU|nr:Hypothetical predicted protein [Pelobates cultripes]